MRLGFTGTQHGLTKQQASKLHQVVIQAAKAELLSVHHGDCIGADAHMHQLALTWAREIVIHPPTDEKKRAYCDSLLLTTCRDVQIVVRAPKPYLERDADIVTETEGLIACPAGMVEVLRSGTWATAREAMRQGKRLAVIFPDGCWKWGTSIKWRYLKR